MTVNPTDDISRVVDDVASFMYPALLDERLDAVLVRHPGALHHHLLLLAGGGARPVLFLAPRVRAKLYHARNDVGCHVIGCSCRPT